MKRSPLRRRTGLRRTAALVPPAHPKKRRAISEATPKQRLRVKYASCVVCGTSPCHPAHLIDRSLCPQDADDPRAVIPLCPRCHRAYDEQNLDLLPYESRFREEMAFAVRRFGLMRTLRRVSNTRWVELGQGPIDWRMLKHGLTDH